MTKAFRSLRILRKNWKLTAIAVFSLSIAMALGVVSLGISNTSLLVAPAGKQPEQMVTIYSRVPGKAIDHFSYPDFQFYRENNHSFSDVAATAETISMARGNFAGPGEDGGPIVTVSSNPVSENYFSVLGLEPFLGRFFAAGDDGTKTPIAVLTYVGWIRLGSDPHVVGKSIGGTEIIGVAPKEFTGSLFGINGDMVVPLPENAATGKRDYRDLQLLGRLKPGVSRSQAQADVSVLSGELATSFPKEDKDRAAIVTRATLLPPDAIPATELAITILLILVLLVLLIACANVANLLLAVAVGRRQEATIKLALGASRGRLIREFLKESIVICAVSGALGYLLAEIVIAHYSDVAVDMPMIGTYSIGLKLHLGLTVILATAALMFIAVLATGLPAALYASSPNLAQILSGELVVGGTRKAMRRNALVIIQVAVCTLVLVGMGLCERSLYNLRQVDPGFSARNLVGESLYPGQAHYTDAKGKEIYEQVRRKISALPGVESVTLALDLPLLNNGSAVQARLPGEAKPISVFSTVVDQDYFSTLGVPVIAGRTFSAADTSPDSDVLVINRQLAQTLWPGQDAVGRGLVTGDPPHKAVVIGIVGNGKYDDLSEEPQPFVYYAYSQHYQPSMNVIARTAGDPRLWLQPLSKAISDTGFDSTLRPMTFANVENLSLLPERLVAGCVAGLSALGLLLAVAGLFGAISYSVSERKKELGIRVALGAQRWQLVEMILRQTARVAGTGIVIGLALGIVTTVLVRSEFYGIGTVEWSVLVPVALAMFAVSLGVAYISARPWIKVDPMEAVRHA